MSDTPSFTYQIQPDGKLPGQSFKEQTEAFLALLQSGIDGVSSTSSAAASDAANALAAAQAAQGAVSALDNLVVHKAGNETITGTKTFNTSPLLTTPAATDNSTKGVNSTWVRALFSATGGFAFGEDGKVYVDFSTMDPAIMQAVVLAMVQSGGGLAVDDNGQLYVDFDSMPTDKFEALLAQIHVPVWIGENGVGTEFYVNGSTGINKTEDGYGKSAAKPWKTIAYATQTIAKNYNINTRNVHINVAGGTYREPVSLPMQSITTGSVTIRPASSNDTVNVFVSTIAENAGDPTGTFCFDHSGGKWILEKLNIKLTIGVQSSGNPATLTLVRSSDLTNQVRVRSCTLAFVDNTQAVDSSHGVRNLRCLYSSGGTIILENTSDNLSTTWTGSQVNATVAWLYIENGGIINAVRSGIASGYTYTVSGAFSTFCYASYQGIFRVQGSGGAPSFVGSGSPTGQRYYATFGGTIITTASDGTDVKTYFPGDSNGTASSTYGSWIYPQPS